MDVDRPSLYKDAKLTVYREISYFLDPNALL